MDFDRDAENKLSYRRMQVKVRENMFLNEDLTYPLWTTKTGWHMPSMAWRESDIRHLGVGISVYFKLLKFLTILFLWFTFLSIPSYVFYYSGSEQGSSHSGFEFALSALSLGNLGHSQAACNYGALRNDTQVAQVYLDCPYGKISNLLQFGLSIPDTRIEKSKCPAD